MSSFFKSSGTSVTIQNTIDTLITDAQAAKTAAETAASNSSTSAGLSSTSANNASSSATDAASSLTSSQTAQAAAETAETNAETAQTAAETAATNSANSASTASTQASNASTSATNASNSASTATTKASEASTSATNAATSATNSANSATASSGSASTASTQASNASTSASNASTSATNASTSASTATTKASEASTSATNAASSASTASTQATNASNSASTASTQATNASNSATAAATSATNAATSASTAQTLSTSFNNIYLGALSSAPSQDPDGSALDEGDLYYDTTQGELKVYKSSGWAAAGSTVNGTSARYHYDITGAVTSVTGADAAGNTLAYDAGYVDVYVNGVRMSTADVTTTSGNAIVFAEALASGDEVDIVGYGTFSVANMNANNLDSGTVPTARVAGAYTGITSVGTLTGFTSTGIDDNATSTAITIDSSENVGIGTTNISSSDKLSISGGRARIVNSVAQSGNTLDNSSFSGLVINNTNDANGDLAGIAMYPTSQYTAAAGVFGYRESQTAGGLSFWTGSNTGSERMRITSAGKVGIGTSNPFVQLELSSVDPILRFNDSNGGTDTKNFELRYVGTSSPDIDGLYFRSVNDANSVYTDRMAILGNGNVGIGTSSPNGNGILTLNTPADNSAQIVFAENDTAKWLIGHRHDGDYFRFYDLSNSAERMRITSSGNVGIGISAPSARLHVGSLNGSGSLNGYTKMAVEGTDYAVMSLKSPAANFNQIIFTDTTSTGLGGINYFNSSNATPNAMAFLTNNAERMRITSSGNVGIGTNSPSTQLNLVGTGGVSKIRFDGNASNLQNNFIGITGYDDLIIASDESNSGSASTIQFRVDASERMRIDSSGRVMIGNTTEGVAGADELTVGNTSAGNGITIRSASNSSGALFFSDGTSGASEYDGGFEYNHSSQFMRISTGGSERVRIDSIGSLLVSCTSLPSGSVSGSALLGDVNQGRLYVSANNTGVRGLAYFFNPNGLVGTINTGGSSTSYNTSSDYRLKENVVTDWDATTRLKQLKPSRFNFIADADTTVDGFLAHEVQEIVPEAITGTKDAVEVWEDGEELPDGVSVGDNKLDDDGNTIPDYQGIDQSKLVPLLVKTIQELEARITALENGE
ncbi:tail fiber domain-containing protein [Alphaproteobacteria bacterium]|nr:tail fiber domain-containing protein [Alphaproteobacteria bacterium]